MTTQERCPVCRRKNTFEERIIGEQSAMMCKHCMYLDPNTIKDLPQEKE